MRTTVLVALLWAAGTPYAAVVEAHPDRPAWLVGSWSARPATDTRWYALLPDGRALVGTRGPDGAPVRQEVVWRFQDERLVLGEGASAEALSVVRLPDVDARPRIRLGRGESEWVRKSAPILHRMARPEGERWPRAHAMDEEAQSPFVGRWLAEGNGAFVDLTLRPDGRCDVRRRVDGEVAVDRDIWEPRPPFSSGPSPPDMSRPTRRELAVEQVWTVAFVGEREDEIDPLTITTGARTWRLVPGSGPVVSEETDLLQARYGFDAVEASVMCEADPHGVGIDIPALDPIEGDPLPAQIEVGARCFLRRQTWVATAGEVGGGPKFESAQRETWVFARSGRMVLHVDTREVVGPDRQPSAERDRTSRFGRYRVDGAVVVVHFDGGQPEDFRLVDGGRFLVRRNLDGSRRRFEATWSRVAHARAK